MAHRPRIGIAGKTVCVAGLPLAEAFAQNLETIRETPRTYTTWCMMWVFSDGEKAFVSSMCRACTCFLSGTHERLL